MKSKLIIFLLSSFVSSVILHAGEAELELFLSACQNSAENQILFRSAYAAFEEQRTHAGGPEEETKRRVEHHMPKNLKSHLKIAGR